MEDVIVLFIVKEYFEKLMMENLINILVNLLGMCDNFFVLIECMDIFCCFDEEYLDYLEDYVFLDDWEWGIIIVCFNFYSGIFWKCISLFCGVEK